MGMVYRKVVTRPVPTTAVLTEGRDGKRQARWTPRGARRPVTAEVVTLDDGREVVRQESGCYFARYRDASGRLRDESTGCRDEDAARQFLADRVRRADRVRAGVISPAEAVAVERSAGPIADQIDAYLATLTGSKSHRENTGRYLRRLADDLKWFRLAEMRRDDLERWIADQSRPGEDGRPIRSARSRDAFRVAAAAFASWCVRVGRLPSNPFAALPKANLAADRRRPRRALTPDQLRRLIEAAQKAPERPETKASEGDASSARRPAQRLTGDDRAALYAVLAGTGLRINEVRLLTVADCRLDDPVPHARLSAAITKNGKADSVPLRADLVAILRPRVEGCRPGEPVFDVPANLIKRFHADCRRAGIDRYDEDGHQVDLHSLRLTFGSYLAAAGVPLTTVQKLMRHSDPKLTANVYTDPRLLDLAGAVESLPSVAPTPSVAPSVALSVAPPDGIPGHSVSPGGTKTREAKAS